MEKINPLVDSLSDQELLYGLTQIISIHHLELQNVVNIIRLRAILDPIITMDLIEAIEEYQACLTEILGRQADILENPPGEDDPIL